MKLNLGCGGSPSQYKDYINCDIVQMDGVDQIVDITETLPWEDNTIDEIWCTSVLEHITFDQVPKAIEEFYRILKPDGKLHVSVPNWETIIYEIKNNLISNKDARRKIFGGTSGEHRYSWTTSELIHELALAKFKNIKDISFENETIILEAYK